MNLNYFNPIEFVNKSGDWWTFMSFRLLIMLDVFRHMCGSAVHVSASKYALGRRLGPDDESQHNVDRWGECRAVDVFISGVYFREQAMEIYRLARSIGFTGIGVYSDTNNNSGEKQVMFHLDSRLDRRMGDPATWGRVSGEYVSLIAAIQSLPSQKE